MLGSDVVRVAPNWAHVTPLSREQLDITDQPALRQALTTASPTIVINCTAYTAVDKAESENEMAHAVNGVAPGRIGEIAAGLAASVIHFSTDYVFDGSGTIPIDEWHPTNPIGVYGKTKLLGEENLARSGADYLILRTSWLYGVSGRSFPRTMWERATTNQPTKVVDDQFGLPTYTVDLARAAWRHIEVASQSDKRKSQPILHVANSGHPVTWYGIAKRVFERAGKQDLISPCSTADFPTQAARPKWSVLDPHRFGDVAGPLPHWEDALDGFLDILEEEHK